MNKKLIIMGASGHGKVIADIARNNGYEEISFLDDDLTKQECAGYKVMGSTETAVNYKEYDFVVGIGNNKIRKQIQNRLLVDEMNIITLIHPNAVVGENVKFGIGTVVMAGTVINSDAKIGDGCIINTGATVDHDSVLENFVHVSVGSHLAGTVHVEEGTMIGAGAVVSNNVSICEECVIGAGAVVVKDIEKSGTYVGVPARTIK